MGIGELLLKLLQHRRDHMHGAGDADEATPGSAAASVCPAQQPGGGLDQVARERRGSAPDQHRRGLACAGGGSQVVDVYGWGFVAGVGPDARTLDALAERGARPDVSQRRGRHGASGPSRDPRLRQQHHVGPSA